MLLFLEFWPVDALFRAQWSRIVLVACGELCLNSDADVGDVKINIWDVGCSSRRWSLEMRMENFIVKSLDFPYTMMS